MLTLRQTSLRLLLGLMIAALALTGCSAMLTTTPQSLVAPTYSAEEVTVPQPTAQTTTMNTPTRPTKLESTPLEIQARLDLAGRLNMPAEEIEVVSVEQTEMPTGSLGCGETGGIQNPGLIIGEEITLRAGGREYTYHSDGQRLVPCSPADFPGGREPIMAAGSRPAQFRAQNLAVTDLAQRLGIAKSAVTVVKIEDVQWPDASLGCPQPGMMYAQVITPGYLITLNANGQSYEYHASQSRVILCEK